MRKTTQEEFISRSKIRHGEKYNYEKVEYLGGKVKVTIKCNKCLTEFNMTPESHLVGQGCRACAYAANGKRKQTSFVEFVEKSQQVHGDKFNYDNVVWRGVKTGIELFCQVHNEYFTTLPAHHLKGADCPRCAKIAGGLKNRSSTSSFVQDAKTKHGDKYDYSAVEYERSDLKVSIRCVKHDKWLSMTPNMHLRGFGGCSDCANDATSERCKKSTEQFVIDAQNIHGSRYEYDRVVYDGVGKKVEIRCKEHDYFWQWPGSHLAGSGCKNCGNFGYKTDLPGTLYVFGTSDLTKVGITNKTTETRRKFISRDSGIDFSILRTYHFDNGRTPLDIETQVLRELWATYVSPTEKFSGSTECFFSVDRDALFSRIETLIQKHTDAQQAS